MQPDKDVQNVILKFALILVVLIVVVSAFITPRTPAPGLKAWIRSLLAFLHRSVTILAIATMLMAAIAIAVHLT